MDVLMNGVSGMELRLLRAFIVWRNFYGAALSQHLDIRSPLESGNTAWLAQTWVQNGFCGRWTVWFISMIPCMASS
jgi:hypothetical protein